MKTANEAASHDRRSITLLLSMIFGGWACMIIGFLICYTTNVHQVPPARAQTSAEAPAKADAAAELTTYTSASEMYAKLAATELPCEGRDNNGTSDGTNIGCWLSQHYASLRTFAHTKLTTAADLPRRDRNGRIQLVITGNNWEVHVTADNDPAVSRRLAEHVATVLGGKIIFAG